MTFLESVNEILTDRFSEAKRTAAKRAYNTRYGRIWAQEPWSFKLGFATYAVSAGASSVALNTLQRIHSFKDISTSPTYLDMDAERPEDHLNHASGTSTIPSGFTVINNTVYFDNPLSSARTFKAMGELKFVPLVADGDVPLLPEEFHQTPIHGAISDLLRLENDPSWNAAEQDYQAGIQDMRKSYLSQVLLPVSVSPAWP